MTPSTIPFFKGTPRERVIVALAAPVLGLVSAWCYVTAKAVLSDSDSATPRARIVLGIMHFLSTELFGAACIFLVLAFVWAVFQPRWIARLMERVSHHVWQAVCLVMLTFLLTALLGSLMP